MLPPLLWRLRPAVAFGTTASAQVTMYMRVCCLQIGDRLNSSSQPAAFILSVFPHQVHCALREIPQQTLMHHAFRSTNTHKNTHAQPYDTGKCNGTVCAHATKQQRHALLEWPEPHGRDLTCFAHALRMLLHSQTCTAAAAAAA